MTTNKTASLNNEICWSTDEEYFHDSLGDLGELEVGQTIYKGIKVPVQPSRLISASDVIEMIGERAYDLVGEAADDYPDVTPEEKEELGAFLSSWITRHCQPTFWRVKDVQPYIVTEEDVA